MGNRALLVSKGTIGFPGTHTRPKKREKKKIQDQNKNKDTQQYIKAGRHELQVKAILSIPF